MQIKLTTVFVDDQDKALRFYTEALGFVKKADFSNGGFRWLTVVAAEAPEGCELQLAAATDPAAKAWQTAQKSQQQPAVMFYTSDLQGDYGRAKAKGAAFVLPPTDVTGSKIAKLDDGCGNLVQLTQLVAWTG